MGYSFMLWWSLGLSTIKSASTYCVVCNMIFICSFYPIGGTNITIRGINLGKEFLDIYGGITVAGIQCDPYESLYVKTEQIVCKVDGPGTKEPRRGPIIVKVADFRGESRDNYEFVDPQIRAIRPKRGPQSGKNKSVCLLLLVVVLVVTFISFTLALDFFVV